MRPPYKFQGELACIDIGMLFGPGGHLSRDCGNGEACMEALSSVLLHLAYCDEMNAL